MESAPSFSSTLSACNDWLNVAAWLCLGAGLGLLISVAVKSHGRPKSEAFSANHPVLTIVPRRGHYAGLALLFMAFAVYGSLVPLKFTPQSFPEGWAHFQQILFSPLSFKSSIDWATNVLLLVPISFCWLAACLVDRPVGMRTLVCTLMVFLLCLAFSVAIEFTQVWFPPRTPSQNDVAAQTIGTILGAAIWLVFGAEITAWCRSFSQDTRPVQQLVWLLQVYLLGVCFYAVLPLDLTVRPAELWEKYQSGRVLLIPFSQIASWPKFFSDLLTDMAIFAPLGVLFSLWPATRDLQRRRSILGAVVWGLSLAVALEFCQLCVFSRTVDVTDVVTETMGVWIGACGWRLWYYLQENRANSKTAADSPPRAWPWAVASFVYAIFLLLYFWSPYELADPARVRVRWARFFEVPFTNLYWSTEFTATTELIRKVLMFGVLGILNQLAATRGATRLPHRGVSILLIATAFVVALTIELGQLLLARSSPCFSDTLICTVGAALGSMVVTRLSHGRLSQGIEPGQ